MISSFTSIRFLTTDPPEKPVYVEFLAEEKVEIKGHPFVVINGRGNSITLKLIKRPREGK